MKQSRTIAFVGQAPGRNGDPAKPLTGKVGRKLAEMGRMPWLTYLRCRRVNLNERFTGKRGNGDAFDRQEGLLKAVNLFFILPDNVVLLGCNVWKCFFSHRCKALDVVRVGRRWFLLMPHPSGINRWWNSAKNRRDASRSLRLFLGRSGMPRR